MRSVSKNLLPAGLKAFLESRGWRCKFPGNDIEFSKDGTSYVFRPLEDVHDPAPLHRAVLCQDPQEAPLLLATDLQDLHGGLRVPSKEKQFYVATVKAALQ